LASRVRLRQPFAARGFERVAAWLNDFEVLLLAHRDILAMSDEAFRVAFQGSPMKRAKLRGLKRNAVMVLGNIANLDDIPMLVDALDDPEQLVREHARWALDLIAADS
jgi:epoxyqueuosine reductase QueG